MKSILFVFLVIMSTLSAFSQNLPNEVETKLKGKNINEQLDILLDFGKKYGATNINNSISCYKAAAGIYEKAKDKSGVAYCLNKAGKVYLQAKKYNNAISEFEKAKELYFAEGNKKSQYNVSFNIGDAYMYKKKYKKAIKSYKEAYNLIKNNSDYKAHAYLLNQLGSAYAKDKQKKEAYNTYEKALSAAKKANLNDLADNIQINLDKAKWNKASKKEKQKIKEEEEVKNAELVQNLKEDIEIKEQQNLLSMQEIEKLSFEMQAKELKLIHIQDEYEKQVMENEIKESNIKLLETQNNLKEFKIKEAKTKIAQQRKTLIIIGSGLAVVSILLLFIIVLYRQKRKNLKIVKKQKEEIDEKNIVLSQANEEIAAQRDELEEQKEVLNKQHLEITDSIKYAEKIQNSILPSNDRISKYIPNYFILFRPKNVVSGDFYWFYKKNNEYWGAVVDCTGHGVPGAFMSMIGNSLLNKIILEQDVTTPAILLKKLNKELDYALNQNRGGDTSDDGMDMTVVKINPKDKKFTISLANHNAVVIKDNMLNRIEGDIFSIGGLFYSEDNEFTNHEISMDAGTSVYMFSDGYQDQFGGKENKKYTIEKMEQKFLSIQNKTLKEQHDIMAEEFDTWKGLKEQIDDILLVGVKF